MASDEGKPLVWCEENVEMLARDADGNIFELVHQCGQGEDHDGSHKCLFCSAEWDMEVPC